MIRIAINCIILIEFVMCFIFFTDAIMNYDLYQKLLYTKQMHNVIMKIHLILFVLMPIYGIVKLFWGKDFKNIFNYFAILGSMLYLVVIYKEIVLDRAF